MKTIKLDIQNKVDILDEMRIFNSIVRMSYNRLRMISKKSTSGGKYVRILTKTAGLFSVLSRMQSQSIPSLRIKPYFLAVNIIWNDT